MDRAIEEDEAKPAVVRDWPKQPYGFDRFEEQLTRKGGRLDDEKSTGPLLPWSSEHLYVRLNVSTLIITHSSKYSCTPAAACASPTTRC